MRILILLFFSLFALALTQTQRYEFKHSFRAPFYLGTLFFIQCPLHSLTQSFEFKSVSSLLDCKDFGHPGNSVKC